MLVTKETGKAGERLEGPVEYQGPAKILNA
jgi:hypothetical protein